MLLFLFSLDTQPRGLIVQDFTDHKNVVNLLSLVMVNYEQFCDAVSGIFVTATIVIRQRIALICSTGKVSSLMMQCSVKLHVTNRLD